MLQIRLSTTAGRQTIVAEATDTPRQVLDANDIAYEGAIVSVDGFPLALADMNAPFNTLGVGESVSLTVVIKTGNA